MSGEAGRLVFSRRFTRAPSGLDPALRVCVLEFVPTDAPDCFILCSNGISAQLIPVLRAALAALEDGSLCMPPAGGFRWVKVGAG